MFCGVLLTCGFCDYCVLDSCLEWVWWIVLVRLFAAACFGVGTLVVGFDEGWYNIRFFLFCVDFGFWGLLEYLVGVLVGFAFWVWVCMCFGVCVYVGCGFYRVLLEMVCV